MEINYTWIFGNPECIISLDGMNQIVKVIHWRLVGTYEQYSSNVYSTVTLPTPENTNDFTPYNELTEEWFIAQVEANTDIEACKATIAANIELQINPVMDNPPLPFAQNIVD